MLDIRGARISMILQDPKFSLNPVQRVGDQIAEAYAVHHRGARRAAREKALEMLEAVQIRDPERVYRLYPHEISGGMGQRVMIAMMLVPEPEVIIADEPTSALDVTVRMKVLGILDALVRERGIGLIMISHDLNLVRNFCDRVLIMYAGQVVEALPAAELAQRPARLYPRPDRRAAAHRRRPVAAGGAAAGGELEAAAGGGEPMSDITIENLTISLGLGDEARKILDDVSFSVRSGQSFGLVGESGSGKSTILKCIGLLFNAWTGRIEIGGKSVRETARKAYCRDVQMVFQDPYGSLHPRHSIRTTLTEPLVDPRARPAARSGWSRRWSTSACRPSFLDRYPHELSGGQRQRVAIARALVLEPSVLLLDEPTSALDVSVQAEVLNLLSDIRAQRKLTYLLVSHDLAVIDHMCDQFAIMLHGRIVEVLDRAAIPGNEATDPYARELIGASLDYDRAA